MHEPLHKLLWLAVLRGVLLRLPPSVVADPDQTANGARFLCAGEGCGAVRAPPAPSPSRPARPRARLPARAG